jgi:hypothetical protein
MDWKDETTYSRDAKEKIPSVWRLGDKTLRISLHRHIYYEPDQWLLSCYHIGLKEKVLKSKDLEKAKKEALAIVEKELLRLVDEFNRLTK